jgi:hypothetical protein
MTGDKSLFVDPNLTASSQKYITFGDNNKGKVMGLGKIAISKDKNINDVLLVQSLGFNIMSIGKLCDLGMLVLFSIIKCIVFMASENSFVFEGIRKGDLYIVHFSKDPIVQTCLLAKATEGWLSVCRYEKFAESHEEKSSSWYSRCEIRQESSLWRL